MSDSTGRNLLMIAYKFPPMHNTACVRTWGFHQSIKLYFDTVTVISTSNRHLLRQEVVDMSDAVVHDAETWDYRTVWQKRERKQPVYKESNKTSLLGKLAQKLRAGFPTIYLVGEGGIKYIRSATKIGARLVKEKKITHIFSTFSPYADHIIAHNLKSRFPTIHWTADFRDLHLDPVQDNLFFRTLQRKWNKKIIGIANIVTTVSKGLCQHLKEFNSNVFVLRNGIIEVSNDDALVDNNKFFISYTGAMYGGRRNPEVVLLAISELLNDRVIPSHEIRLAYAGSDSSIWHQKVNEYGIEEIFIDLGLISRKESLELQRRSNINILLTYSFSELKGILTGKIYEYFNARRPVLVHINGPRDTEIEELVPTDLGIVVYHDNLDRIKAFITKEYNNWKNGKPSGEGVDYAAALTPFLWENMIEDFARRIGLV